MLRFFVNLQKKGPIFAAGLSTFWLVERKNICSAFKPYFIFFSRISYEDFFCRITNAVPFL